MVDFELHGYIVANGGDDLFMGPLYTSNLVILGTTSKELFLFCPCTYVPGDMPNHINLSCSSL